MWRYSLSPSILYTERDKIEELYLRLMNFHIDEFHSFFEWLQDISFFNNDGKLCSFINIILTCSEYNSQSIENYSKILKETQQLFRSSFGQVNVKTYLLNVISNPLYLTNSQCLLLLACFKEEIFDIQEFLVFFHSYFNTDYEIPKTWLRIIVWFGSLIETADPSFFQDCVKQYVDIFKHLFASESLKNKSIEFDELHLKNHWSFVTQHELIGQNPNELVNIIKKDDAQTLKHLYKLKKFKVNERILPSIIELHSLLQNSPTLIEVCCLYNSVKCFEFLREKCAKLSLLDKKGLNVVHYAASGGSSDILNLLSDSGFSLNGSLHFAALYHQYETFDNLCQKEKDLLEQPISEYGTILHMCAKSNNIKTMNFCIQNKANVNSRNEISFYLIFLKFQIETFQWNFFLKLFYQTPLHLAILSRSFESVLFLVEVPNILLKAQDSNAVLLFFKIYQTPLHLASLYGFTEAVRAILSKKDVGINMIDNDGRTPLHYAVISGSKNIVSLLCSFQGININMIDHVILFIIFFKGDDDEDDDEKEGI